MGRFEGQCLCGAVRFAITPPTLFCAHCHCRFCRAAHGAGFVTWAGAHEDRFELLAGEDLLHWYQSSPQSRRGFCSVCGSSMFYTSTLSPGEVHVARALIPGEIDRAPQAHVFYDHRQPWIDCPDEVPKIDSSSQILEKYQAVE
jgi:hypothetical protein